jgi:hypothetical protein
MVLDIIGNGALFTVGVLANPDSLLAIISLIGVSWSLKELLSLRVLRISLLYFAAWRVPDHALFTLLSSHCDES